ncbi:hypothetical protein L207DRAFT_600653 [Hyaloscypha variabilis F]|uniref:Uncharacterized protein n=1 Tax=Hyaloscypha variabilis (strain UAMH 11265 / GT02V1 / F) TaxID=1149755 RepID=A0A2J6RDG8_HYAVF|nr:hypothetical protein L207DRAFT_600653 [Hyaloscypha variabilis F]
MQGTYTSSATSTWARTCTAREFWYWRIVGSFATQKEVFESIGEESEARLLSLPANGRTGRERNGIASMADRLCRAEILNNQSCRRGARCDVCGGYGGYGATIITALDQRISQETKGNRREDRECCAAEDGEQNRSSLLKRVSAFASRNPPIPVTPRKRSEANCSPQDSFIGRDETNHCPLQSPSSTPAECGQQQASVFRNDGGTCGAMSIEKGSACARTPVAGVRWWMWVGMLVSSFAIMERLISGHQTPSEEAITPRITVPNRVYLPVLETRLAFESVLREVAACDGGPTVLRAIQMLRCSRYSSDGRVDRCPSPRPMGAHPCLGDRRARDALEALARKRTQRGQLPAAAAEYKCMTRNDTTEPSTEYCTAVGVLSTKYSAGYSTSGLYCTAQCTVHSTAAAKRDDVSSVALSSAHLQHCPAVSSRQGSQSALSPL